MSPRGMPTPRFYYPNGIENLQQGEVDRLRSVSPSNSLTGFSMVYRRE